MSETDSFIEEVSEEVRRDRLFGYIRRYGWIAVLAVVVLVGGAAYNEYTKARTQAAAQAKGDALLAALALSDSAERQAALAALPEDLQGSPIVAMLSAGTALEAEDAATAVAALAAVAEDAEQPQLYRDMAQLKHTILTAPDTAPGDRISALAGVAVAGSPFRVLAEEQIALAEIEMGEQNAGVARLRALLIDTETSQGLRVRVQQLLVALGEDLDPA